MVDNNLNRIRNDAIHNPRLFHKSPRGDLAAVKRPVVGKKIGPDGGVRVHPKRKMLEDIFALLRSQSLSIDEIESEFINIYRPRYKEDVIKLFALAGRYNVEVIKHSVLNRQRLIISRLMPIVSEVAQ